MPLSIDVDSSLTQHTDGLTYTKTASDDGSGAARDVFQTEKRTDRNINEPNNGANQRTK